MECFPLGTNREREVEGGGNSRGSSGDGGNGHKKWSCEIERKAVFHAPPGLRGKSVWESRRKKDMRDRRGS